MKKVVTLASAMALGLGLATSAVAADKSNIGFGVSHSSADTTAVYLPIQPASGKLWFEPYFGYSNSSPKNGSSTSSVALGTGLFVDFESNKNTRAYFGGRIGIESVSPAMGDSYTAFSLAPTVGFGYLPVKNVMFGAEAALSFSSSDAGTEMGTGSAIFARYFFK